MKAASKTELLKNRGLILGEWINAPLPFSHIQNNIKIGLAKGKKYGILPSPKRGKVVGIMQLFKRGKKRVFIKLKKREPVFEIDPNNPILVSQDLFALMIEVDRTLRAHGMPSIYFISDMISEKSKVRQIEIIIDALADLQNKLEEETNK